MPCLYYKVHDWVGFRTLHIPPVRNLQTQQTDNEQGIQAKHQRQRVKQYSSIVVVVTAFAFYDRHQCTNSFVALGIMTLFTQYMQYNTTLLSLYREICLLARHLLKTFNTFYNKTVINVKYGAKQPLECTHIRTHTLSLSLLWLASHL